MTARRLRRAAALALACFAFAAPARAEDEEAPLLTEPIVRGLLDAAAAAPRAWLEPLLSGRSIVRPGDAAHFGSLPLTLAVIVVPWWTPEALADVTIAARMLPGELFRTIAGESLSPSTSLSLLRADALEEVRFEVSGLSARGTAAFRFGERLRGRVAWTAAVEDGAWRVLSIRFPSRDEGVAWLQGRWWFDGRDELAGSDGPRVLRPASDFAVWTQELPELGLLGAVANTRPSSACTKVLSVAVTRDGALLGPEGVLTLADLRTAGEKHGLTGPRKPVVLRTPAWGPWHVVGWVIDALRVASGSPPHDVYVAGRFEPMTGMEIAPWFPGEGVMALGRLQALAPGAAAPLEVHIEPDEGRVPAPSAFRVLREHLAGEAPATRRVVLHVGGEGRVRAGHVLELADLALRAGARDVDFASQPLPPVPEGGGKDHGPTFMAEHARAHPVVQTGFRLRIGTTELRGDPPVPPPPRNAPGKPAGADMR